MRRPAVGQRVKYGANSPVVTAASPMGSVGTTNRAAAAAGGGGGNNNNNNSGGSNATMLGPDVNTQNSLTLQAIQLADTFANAKSSTAWQRRTLMSEYTNNLAQIQAAKVAGLAQTENAALGRGIFGGSADAAGRIGVEADTLNQQVAARNAMNLGLSQTKLEMENARMVKNYNEQYLKLAQFGAGANATANNIDMYDTPAGGGGGGGGNDTGGGGGASGLPPGAPKNVLANFTSGTIRNQMQMPVFQFIRDFPTEAATYFNKVWPNGIPDAIRQQLRDLGWTALIRDIENLYGGANAAAAAPRVSAGVQNGTFGETSSPQAILDYINRVGG